MILALSPEGTRSPIKNWKTGFLHIAKKANVPVMLVGLDYAKKQIQFGEIMSPIDDIEEAMRKVYRFYAKVHAKFPDKVAFPLENQID